MTTDRTERRIFLGMPGYGKMTAAAGCAFWRASADMRQVHCEYRNGSLLASNFNQLWCTGLNMVHQGERLDYWAMIHDDVGPLAVGPDDYWLDMLIDELEANKLDVLSVVVPIKDRRGMTSMALQHPSDEWMPFARLSMHDVYQLPETFTADDLGRPLLLNTGCFVVKWNQAWCRQIHFSIEDRIVLNTACNRYQAQTVPEDWHLSKQLNSLGLKIGATRKIALNHRGEVDFPNYVDPYPGNHGTHPFDREAVKVSPVPGSFPSDIDGWLTELEGKALAELARGKRVLEIGSYCGLSTVCMARTAAHVTAVDYFDGRGTPCPQDTLAAFKANIERYGVADKVEACHPDAVFPLPEYDLAFIDGAHEADSVRADIRKALDVLAPDGVLAFHDYGITDPGVIEAVQELIADGATTISLTDSLAVVRPPAAIPLEV
jgi:SAM-dependent methyltransferase